MIANRRPFLSPYRSPGVGPLLEVPEASSDVLEYATVLADSVKVLVNGELPEHFKDFIVGPGQPEFRVAIATPWVGAQIRTTVTPMGSHSGIVHPSIFSGPEIGFTPDVNQCRPTNGSREPNASIGYVLEIEVTLLTGRELRLESHFEQDEISTLRQEYLDYEKFAKNGVPTPERSRFGVGPKVPNFRPSEFVRQSNYSVSLNQGMHTLAQRTRDVYGSPIVISSGFRNPQRNNDKEVKGAKNSRHMQGQAVDMVPEVNVPGERFLLYVASIESGPGLSLLEKGARQLLPGDKKPDGATLDQATDLVLAGKLLTSRRVNEDGSVSFLVATRQTKVIQQHTVFSQRLEDGKEIKATVDSVEYRSAKEQDLATFPKGTALEPDKHAELRTPYAQLFGIASHTHKQTL